VRRYHARLSGLLLDRIDLHVEVSPAGAGDARGESSATERERVARAREFRERRPAAPREGRAAEWAGVDRRAHELLRAARERLALSERAVERVVRVARTIADLAERESVDETAIAEAISYRARSFGATEAGARDAAEALLR